MNRPLELTRQDAEREQAADRIAWAREHAPDLLPEDESDPEAWDGVLEAIGNRPWPCE